MSEQISVTLPDGSTRQLPAGSSGFDLANAISPRLAAAALAVRVNDSLTDLHDALPTNAQVRIITDKDEADALELIRHDMAHVLAMAVQNLYPQVQVTIGPVIDDGFYYDFATQSPFTPDDLTAIDAEMRRIIASSPPTRKELWQRDALKEKFAAAGEDYKVQIIDSIPEGQDISLYYHGEWFDVCRGPHLPSVGRTGGAFALTRVAGAYWRGDAKNAMLSRIYGTAWRTDKELQAYLHRVAEAERRDHRKLGKELSLFHIQEEAAGMVFWHPAGHMLWQTLEDYMRRMQRDNGYHEIKTPQLVDRKLWEASGHWEKFRQNMYTIDSEERVFALKPMNCPCHVQIFNHALRSYRELPLRLSEFGSCHRYEPSGALHGLMRVRNFVQDDAHIFCTPQQITAETLAYCNMLQTIYSDLGFDSFSVKFSDRPAVRAGSDETWDKAEGALRDAVQEAGYEITLNSGEGAFYGPKLEFVLRDAIGRDWQCGTLQVDFVMPERLDAHYIGEDSQRHRPVMLHRAILGSFERFIGILIEQYAGAFPLWLAPTQVVVATVVSDADDYAQKVQQILQNAGIRAVVDARSDKISYKVREHMHAKVPILLAVGRREAEEGTVSMRRFGSDAATPIALHDLATQMAHEALPPDLRRKTA